MKRRFKVEYEVEIEVDEATKEDVLEWVSFPIYDDANYSLQFNPLENTELFAKQGSVKISEQND